MKIGKKYLIIAFTFILLLLGTTISYGTYSASDSTVNSEGKVTIQVTSSEPIDAYNLELTNNTGLTFNSCSKVDNQAIISINGSSIAYMNISGTTKELGTYNFTAPKVEKDTDYTVEFLINKSTTVTSKITIKAPHVQTNNPQPTSTPTKVTTQTLDSNANLKDLGIKPKEYDFTDFTYSKTNYTVEVPNEIEEIEVFYTKASNKSEVKVTGGKGARVENGKTLVKLSNQAKDLIEIKVTAEKGNTKTYKITVTRKTEENETKEETPTPVNENPEEIVNDTPSEGLIGLTIPEVEISPEFKTDVYEYTVKLKKDLNQLDIQAQAQSVDYTVVISGNENLQDGENLINIMVYNAKNSIVASYQLTVMKNTVNQNEINNIFKEVYREQNIKTIILISVLGLILVLIIIYIVISIKNKSKSNVTTEQKDEDPAETVDKKEENSETYVDKKKKAPTKDKEEKTIEKKKGKHF